MTRVLLIEDDPLTKRLIEQNLQKLIAPVEIISYPSIDHLNLDKISINRLGDSFDLMILDIFLAGDKTGIDFAKLLSREEQARTILSSSISEVEFMSFAVKNDLNCRFVKKPLQTGTLQKHIKQILHKTKSQDLNPFPENANSAGPQEKLLGTLVGAKTQPVIFVTGCNSKAGELLCKTLIAKTDFRVAGTAAAQHCEELRQQIHESHRVMILPLDLTNQAQVKDTVASVLKKWGRIDILVNNESVCYRSVVEHLDVEGEFKQLGVNYIGPMTLIRSVAPVMRENGRGKIINISFSAAVNGMPTMSSFTASTAALESASETLWYELKPFGINVSVVRSAFANADHHRPITTSTKAKMSEVLMGPYSDYYRFIRPLLQRFIDTKDRSHHELINSILFVIKTQNPPLWVHDSLKASLFSLARRFLPTGIYYSVMNLFFVSNRKLGLKYTRAQKRRLAA